MSKIIAIMLLFSVISLQAKPLKIAALYPNSGPQADFTCMTKAVIRESKRWFKEPVELIVFDTANDMATALKQSEIVVKGGFDLVLGTRTSQEALVVAPRFEAAKIPFFVPIASHPDITKNRQYVHRLISNSYLYNDLLAAHAIQSSKIKRISIVTNLSAPFSVEGSKIFRESIIKRAGSAFHIDQIDIVDGIKNLEESVKKIVQNRPDVIFLPIYPVEALEIIKQLKIISFHGLVLGNASINDGRDLMALGNSSNSSLKIRFNGVWDGKLSGPLASVYKSMRQRMCSDQPDNLRTVAAFDLTVLALMASQKAISTKNEISSDSLRKINFFGVMGPLIYGEDGDPIRPMPLFSLEGNQAVLWHPSQK